MILGLFTHWRIYFFVGLLALVAVGGFLPSTGDLLLSSWWIDHQSKQIANWQIARRTIPVPQWWIHIHQGYRWVRAGLGRQSQSNSPRVCHWGLALGLGICLFLLGHVLTHPTPPWAWLCLLAASYTVTREIRCVLSDWIEIKPATTQPAEDQESAVEVTIDLEPLLAELGDLSPTSGEFGSRVDEIGCFGSQAQAETLFYLILEREKAKHAVV